MAISGSFAKSRSAQAAAARASRTDLLLGGAIGPTLTRLAAPNTLAMMVQATIGIGEGYFASRIGVSALAGQALVFPLVMLTQMLSNGSIGGGISSAIARALGARDIDRANALVIAAWIIAISFASIFAGLIVFFGTGIFSALGGVPEAIKAALDYATIFFPGCFTVWLCQSSLSVVRGTGDMQAAAKMLALVSLCAVPLSGALGLGWGPFPALGMAGLAAGSIIAHGIGGLVAISYLVLGHAGLSLRKTGNRLRLSLFKDILSIGLMGSVNAVLTVSTNILIAGLVSRFGEAALAGYGLGARLEFLMIPIVFGIGSAMTAMVGANIGSGDKVRALRVAWTGSLVAAGIVGTLGLLFAIAPDLWLHIFLTPSKTAALEAGRTYFHFVAPFYAFLAIGLALYFASLGAGKLFWPIAAGISRITIAVAGAVALTSTTAMGINGVFAAIGAGMLVYGLLTACAVWITKWR